jgi:hypothetical protein
MMLIYSEIKIPLTDYTNKQSCRFKKKKQTKLSWKCIAATDTTSRSDLTPRRDRIGNRPVNLKSRTERKNTRRDDAREANRTKSSTLAPPGATCPRAPSDVARWPFPARNPKTPPIRRVRRGRERERRARRKSEAETGRGAPPPPHAFIGPRPVSSWLGSAPLGKNLRPRTILISRL